MKPADQMLNIDFFGVKDGDQKYLTKRLPNGRFGFYTEHLTSRTISKIENIENLEIISVFINSELNSANLSKFPKLKYIVTRSTGYDHIDLAYCKKKGILVSNVPNYGQNTVAEHAMALVLSISRRIPESIKRVREESFSPIGLTGFDLKDKVIGVIGTGSIGKCFIKMALGFDARVIAYDAYPNLKTSKEMGFEYVKLDYLLAKSDVISLHVPYLKETHHIINRKAIAKMKDGVVLINTSRGGLVETDALFDAIKTGKISGVGLDVVEEEGFLAEELELLEDDRDKNVNFKIALENHLLAHLPNVIITPHNAFNSKEALERILATTVENIMCYAKGDPINLVK